MGLSVKLSSARGCGAEGRSGWGYHCSPSLLADPVGDRELQSGFLAPGPWAGLCFWLSPGCCCENTKPRLGWIKGSAPLLSLGIRSPLEQLDFLGEEEAVLGGAGGDCPSVQ